LITEVDVFKCLYGYCGYSKYGPIGKGEVVLADGHGDEHVFVFESFSNRYEVLTLGICARPRSAAVLV
jgi:hypothetical protein